MRGRRAPRQVRAKPAPPGAVVRRRGWATRCSGVCRPAPSCRLREVLEGDFGLVGGGFELWKTRACVIVRDWNGVAHVVLRSPKGASARVSLHGGQVVLWRNDRGEELLFISSKVLRLCEGSDMPFDFLVAECSSSSISVRRRVFNWAAKNTEFYYSCTSTGAGLFRFCRLGPWQDVMKMEYTYDKDGTTAMAAAEKLHQPVRNGVMKIQLLSQLLER